MEVPVFHPHELAAALGALRAIIPHLSPAQGDFLRVLARLHGTNLDPAALEMPAPRETALAISDPHHRKRLVECAIVMAMVDGEVERATAAAVAGLAEALGVEGRMVRNLVRVAARHRFLVRVDMSRRIFGKFAGEAFREEGLAGVKKFIGPMLSVGKHPVLAPGRLGQDPAMAHRFRELRHLPAGSFGRTLWEHCTSRGFAFPGEPGGIPARAMFHDLGHVLSGYDTDPAGEIQQAAFQAGFVRKEGFSFLFFGIAHFHLGLKIAPIAEAEVGYFDVEKVVTALARGAACTVDLSDHWDFWPLLPLPLDDVRRMLHIPALSVSAARAA